MTQGFVTIATGDLKYYILARNLLRSYRQTCSKQMRFAIISDTLNEYTEEFDDQVILSNPSRSWMDKMELLSSCPYDENIFIDADCIIYKDINYLWDLFEYADDFSCFGRILGLNESGGWFTREIENFYPINYIVHLHGIIYYIRKSKKIEEMKSLCKRIIADYDLLDCNGFGGAIADEPIYAIAMAVLNLKPIERKPEYYCFVPFSINLKTNYYTKKVIYENSADGIVNDCSIIHWGNKNTAKCKYRFDAKAINYLEDKHNNLLSIIRGKLLFKYRALYLWYYCDDKQKQFAHFSKWVFDRAIAKISNKG